MDIACVLPVVSVASEKVTTTTTDAQPRPAYRLPILAHLNMVRRRRNRYGLNFRVVLWLVYNIWSHGILLSMACSCFALF